MGQLLLGAPTRLGWRGVMGQLLLGPPTRLGWRSVMVQLLPLVCSYGLRWRGMMVSCRLFSFPAVRIVAARGCRREHVG